MITTYNHQKQKERDEIGATSPKPGDYWQEMLSGTCVVLQVTMDAVTLCRKKTQYSDGWEWDLSQVMIMSRPQFKAWLSYKAPNLGYWSSISNHPQLEVVSRYKEMKSKIKPIPYTEGLQLEMSLSTAL